MRKVIAVEWMSLDGVIQSAGADDRLVDRQVASTGAILATYARAED
jgi:hypothetical protein